MYLDFRHQKTQSVSFSTAIFYRQITTTTPQPFYGPFSGTTGVSQCQKRTSGLHGARED